MVIRQEQIQGIEDAMLQEYAARAAAFFRVRAGDFVQRFDKPTLLNRIKAAIPRARKFGIHTPEGMLRFIGLTLAAGPAIDENPAVEKFLRMPGASPDVKIQRLVQLISERLNPGPSQNG